MKQESFIEVTVPPNCGAHIWPVEELDSVELVFDGGDEKNPPLLKPVPKKPVLKKPVPSKKPWRSVRVSAGELSVADTK